MSAEAEPAYQRAVSGPEKTLGKDHVVTLTHLHGLGCIYVQLGKMSEAEVANWEKGKNNT
jgi:hypothetical protein